ncbi:hypothetical protein [Vibrio metoecus]|nr:hypothetical protein [Vibrio metoecus]
MAAVREGLKNFNMFHVPYVGASYCTLMLIFVLSLAMLKKRSSSLSQSLVKSGEHEWLTTATDDLVCVKVKKLLRKCLQSVNKNNIGHKGDFVHKVHVVAEA